MDKAGKRTRGANFTIDEVNRLVEILKDYTDIIEIKEGDTRIWERKQRAWEEINTRFNALFVTQTRTPEQLKKKYESLKKFVKKKRVLERQQILRGDTENPVEYTYAEAIINSMLVGINYKDGSDQDDQDESYSMPPTNYQPDIKPPIHALMPMDGSFSQIAVDVNPQSMLSTMSSSFQSSPPQQVVNPSEFDDGLVSNSALEPQLEVNDKDDYYPAGSFTAVHSNTKHDSPSPPPQKRIKKDTATDKISQLALERGELLKMQAQAFDEKDKMEKKAMQIRLRTMEMEFKKKQEILDLKIKFEKEKIAKLKDGKLCSSCNEM